MKRKSIICCLIVLAMCLSVFAACVTTDTYTTNFDADTLQAMITNIALEQYQVTSTPASYQLNRKVETYDAEGNPATLYVKWTIEDQPLVTITENDDTVTVNIPDSRVAPIGYKLRATLTDANGKAYTKDDGTNYTAVFDRVAPFESDSGNQGGNNGGDQDDNNGGNDKVGNDNDDNLGNQGSNDNTDDQGGNDGDVSDTETRVVTIVASSQGLADQSDIVSPLTVDGITLSFSLSGGTTPPRYWSEAFRVYYGNTLTISGATITRVVFNFAETGGNGNEITANSGSFSTDTWTGSTSSLTFTIGVNSSGGKSGHVRITSIDIYINGTSSGDDIGDNVGDQNGSESGTYNFDFASTFGTYASGWSNQYNIRTLSASDLGVSNANVTFEFSNVSKQTGTITNMPVMASKNAYTEYVTATVSGATISSVTFNLAEWVPGGNGAAKTFTTLTIEYSTDGNNWNATNVGLVNGPASQVSNYSTLTCNNLPSGVVAVRLVIVGVNIDSNQQVGIQGCSLVLG